MVFSNTGTGEFSLEICTSGDPHIYMSRVTTMDPNWNHLTSHQLEESVGRSTQEPPIFHGTNRWMDGFQSPEAIATLTDSQSITVGFVPMFSWVIRFAYVWITLFVCEFPMKLVKTPPCFSQIPFNPPLNHLRGDVPWRCWENRPETTSFTLQTGILGPGFCPVDLRFIQVLELYKL